MPSSSQEHLTEEQALVIEPGGVFTDEDLNNDWLPATFTGDMRAQLMDTVPIFFNDFFGDAANAS